MSARQFISEYRWPIYIVGILSMSIVAHAVLVFVATRPSAPRPMANYYQRSLEWDADSAVLEASRALGWQVQLEVPAGAHYALAARRPVDLRVLDRDGQPVRGLTGRLIAKRPADSRLNSESALVELPHVPGSYRALAPLPVAGLWELSLDAKLGGARFVHVARVTVAEEATE